MRKALLPLLLLTGMLLGCHKTQWLTGYYSREAFLDTIAWHKPINTSYRADAAVLAELAQVDSFELKLFFSSWCHDSKREVPRFLSIEPQLPLRSFQMIALDTTRLDERGLAPALGVKVTPIFVVFRNGQELGRIVERPQESLEADLLRIAQTND